MRKKHHPFTALLRSEEIPSISVAELLCGQSFPGITFPACDLNRAASVLSGKVVLIGNEDDRDRIDTPVEKRMPGVFLQANYVESLLDGHFLRPVSRLVETAVVLVWILFLEFWFNRKGIPETKALLALAIGVVLWMVCAFITLLTGYFMLLWGIPAVLAIGTKYLDARIDSIRKRALANAAP